MFSNISSLYIIKKIMENFCNELIENLSSLREICKGLGIDTNKAFPAPFKGNNIKIQCNYSIDLNQFFIIFNRDNKSSFSFSSGYGNPIPFPINFTGTKGYSVISNATLVTNVTKLSIDYSLILSHDGLVELQNNLLNFAIHIIKSTIDFNKYVNQQDRESYIAYLNNLKAQMCNLFFNESTDELVIDKFLEENPIILEHGLNLVELKHQIILKNILNIYEHDLKPDLIAYNLSEKNWSIIDYKKAKRSIIKNLDKVRTGFRSDVTNLKNQIRDYIEYFNENDHRRFIENTYKISINFPSGIGIIGNVNENEQIEFQRLLKDEPRWFKVIPYNYLYDNFCGYLKILNVNDK